MRRWADRDRLQQPDDPGIFHDSVIRQFEIIGEATSNVAERTRQRFPTVPWREMSGMRNKLVHEYWDVATAIIERTVQEDLPILAATIRHDPGVRRRLKDIQKMRTPFETPPG
ncbi:MAG: HepT-like ribonuclease domain-containing protein [Acidimicrobiales bacterium]